MKKTAAGSAKPGRNRPSGRWLRVIFIMAVLLPGFGWLVAKFGNQALSGHGSPPRPTFHRDVAPILLSHCAPCHRPGQAAPFPLLTYADARKRAHDIVEVTTRRIMPPWLPESGPGEFVGQRTLTEVQIETLRRWMAQGSVEGAVPPVPPPVAPGQSNGWQLGQPDLIARMSEPFALAADGGDVYRNFVLPLTNTARRFVRAIEFQPDNPRLVHHAFFRLDATRASRQRDAAEPAPGFDGLHAPASAQTPEGHFLSWQPGQLPRREPAGMEWTLETNCDLVIQMHLRPAGKPEQLQASVGLYFSATPPSLRPVTLGMRHFDLDIPAGSTAHVVRDSIELPVAVDVLAVLPHAHSLGHDLRAYATLPGGGTRPLIHIPRWDIHWQGDYQYATPIALPAGAVVTMEYTYDNSTNNPANPHQPPTRVRYGLQTDDEMAELWLQVLPHRPEDRDALMRSYQPRVLRETIGYHQYLLRQDPNDAHALSEIGKSHLLLGDQATAEFHLRAAMRARPELDEPHYWLGLSFRLQKRSVDAQSEFAAATRLNPSNGRAWGNLGLVLLELGQTEAAESALNRALALDANDRLARETLDEIIRGQGRKR